MGGLSVREGERKAGASALLRKSRDRLQSLSLP
jgi:hypothetical protein